MLIDTCSFNEAAAEESAEYLLQWKCTSSSFIINLQLTWPQWAELLCGFQNIRYMKTFLPVCLKTARMQSSIYSFLVTIELYVEARSWKCTITQICNSEHSKHPNMSTTMWTLTKEHFSDRALYFSGHPHLFGKLSTPDGKLYSTVLSVLVDEKPWKRFPEGEGEGGAQRRAYCVFYSTSTCKQLY